MIDPRRIATLGFGFGALAVASLGFVAVESDQLVDTIQIIRGGSGWNLEEPSIKLVAKNRLGEQIEIEDEEIIEFLTVFAIWRSQQT